MMPDRGVFAVTRGVGLLLLAIAGNCFGSEIALEIVQSDAAPAEVRPLLTRGEELLPTDCQRAVTVLREALRIHRELAGADSPETIVTLERLAIAQSRSGAEDDAIANWQLIHQLAVRAFGKEDFRAIGAAAAVQSSLRRKSFSEAQRKSFAEANESLMASYGDLAHQTAIDRLSRALELFRATLGPGSRDARRTRFLLALRLVPAGQYDRGVEVLLRDLAELKREFGETHPFYAQEEGLLCLHYNLLGRQQDAVEHGRLVLKVDERSKALKLEAFKEFQKVLVATYLSLGQQKEAEQVAQVLMKSATDNEGHPGRDFIAAANVLATAMTYGGQKKDRAMLMLIKALEDIRGRGVYPFVDLNEAELTLAKFCVDREEWAHAVTYAEEVRRRPVGVDPALRGQRAHATELLGTAYVGQGRMDDAIPLLKSTFELYRSGFGSDDKRTLRVRAQLLIALEKTSRAYEVEAMLSEPRPFPPR